LLLSEITTPSYHARGAHRKAALSIEGCRKILVEKVHEALQKVFDLGGFVLDGREPG
jgi:hypothetical protein